MDPSTAATQRGLLSVSLLTSRTTIVVLFVAIGVALVMSCTALVYAVRASTRSAFDEITATHLTLTGSAAWQEALAVDFPGTSSGYGANTAGIRIKMPQYSASQSGSTHQTGIAITSAAPAITATISGAGSQPQYFPAPS